MAPLCLDDRSELTTQPPRSLATSAMLSIVRATSSTTRDMRAVWTMMRFWAGTARCALPPSLPSDSWDSCRGWWRHSRGRLGVVAAGPDHCHQQGRERQKHPKAPVRH